MNKVFDWISKNKSGILTVLTSVGVAATGYLGVRAGKKSEKDGEKWTNYIPVAAVGTVTIAGIVVNHRINVKQIAALGATAAYLAANRDAIEESVKERFGEDALNDIRADARKKTADVDRRSLVAETTGNGDLLCFEGYSGRWFRSDEESVRKAIRTLDERFRDGEYLCLNDFYELLGIEPTHFGHQFGWAANEDYYDYKRDGIAIKATFMNDLSRNEPVLAIEIFTYPMECWMEV